MAHKEAAPDSLDALAAGFDHNDHGMRAHCAEVYGRLRGGCPVFHSEQWGGFWVASRYEDVYEVGRDVERFASAPGVMVPPVGHGRPLLPMEADPPEHPAYRELLLPRFAPGAVAELEDDVRALAAELVDEIAERGRADLYETLAKPLPMLMITHLLGIERDEAFWEWTDTLMYGRVHGHPAGRDPRGGRDLYGFLDRDDRAAQARAGRRPHLAAAGRHGRRAGRTARTRSATSASSCSSPGSRTPASASARRCATWPCGPTTAPRCSPTRRS